MCLQGVFFCTKCSHVHLNSLHMSADICVAHPYLISITDIFCASSFILSKATIKADDCLDLSLPNLFSSSVVTFSLDSSWLKSLNDTSLGLSSHFDDEMFLVIFLVLFFDWDLRFLGGK